MVLQNGNSLLTGAESRVNLNSAFAVWPKSESFGLEVDLLQVSLAEKTGEGKTARETCNTWHAH